MEGPYTSESRTPTLLAYKMEGPYTSKSRTPTLLACKMEGPYTSKSRTPTLLACKMEGPYTSKSRTPTLLAYKMEGPYTSKSRTPTLLTCTNTSGYQWRVFDVEFCMGRKTVFLLMSFLCLWMATVLVQIEPGPKVSDINLISSTLLKYIVDC